MIHTMSIKKQKEITNHPNLITESYLKAQEANYDVGFWNIPRMIHGESLDFIIARTRGGDYLLTRADLQSSIISCTTLALAAKQLNKYVHDANAHDYVLLPDWRSE